MKALGETTGTPITTKQKAKKKKNISKIGAKNKLYKTVHSRRTLSAVLLIFSVSHPELPCSHVFRPRDILTFLSVEIILFILAVFERSPQNHVGRGGEH